VIDPDPPLRITSKLSEVGNLTGRVHLWEKTLLNLSGVQPNNQTAGDRADQLNRRLTNLIGRPGRHGPDEILVQPALLLLCRPAPRRSCSETGFCSRSPTRDAQANGAASALQLARMWPRFLRSILSAAMGADRAS
jgi:hypothetical protein